MTASLPTLCGRVGRTRKRNGAGVHRTVGADVTWRRTRDLLPRIGVTRIADITGMDHVGIPVYSCIRPLADPASVSVTCGKGTSAAEARAGAVMEAIEYHCAESGVLPVRLASFAALSRTERALDPVDLILPVWSPYAPDRPLEWVPGWDLVTGDTWWVPANAVFHPYVPSGEPLMILRGSTNGLASGNVIEEAICHGLAEVIERDAWCICWVDVRYGQGHRYPGVELTHAAGPIRNLVDRFHRRGVDVRLRDITSPLGVPAYYAATFERTGTRYLAHEGMGAHPDPSVALQRALTEAAQSRAADIQGSREDLGYWRRRAGEREEPTPSWGASEPARRTPFPGSRGACHADIRDDIAWMVERLSTHGMDRILVVDLTRPELAVPVVRVIVPGLEFVAIDEYRVGPRAYRAMTEAQRAAPHGVHESPARLPAREAGV